MSEFSIFAKLATGAILMIAPLLAYAESSPKMPLPEAKQAQIVFLGEQHDNASHHALQAEWVAALEPRALVFEMLTPEQAASVTAENRSDRAALETALQWHNTGWPDFGMYFPIFTAAPQAAILGAGVQKEQLRAAMKMDVVSIVGSQAARRFGLDQPLPEEQQKSREALQREAHCNALPEDLLPRMVSAQRLRDAALAQAALQALEDYGGSVVVITGNGHAREDWGAPFLIRQATPDVSVFSLGQGEAGQAPQGGFGMVADSPPVDRGDPCAAFK